MVVGVIEAGSVSNWKLSATSSAPVACESAVEHIGPTPVVMVKD